MYSTITTFLYFIQACKAAETIVTNTQFILITGLKDYKWTIKKKKKKTKQEVLTLIFIIFHYSHYYCMEFYYCMEYVGLHGSTSFVIHGCEVIRQN